MKKYRMLILVLLLLAILMLTGCGKDDGVKTFADWTDNKLFQNIPALYNEGNRIGEATDYGDGTYVITINGTSLEQYQSYLATLEDRKSVV